MNIDDTITLSVFDGYQRIYQGDLQGLIQNIKPQDPNVTLLIFNDLTGKILDINFNVPAEQIYDSIIQTYPELAPKPKTRGRPKLGVIAKEITLLPRHWEWLAEQRGGASATLRRLIDQARKATLEESQKRKMHERTYQFLHAIAGDLPNYEECLRALFANNLMTFRKYLSDWPADIQAYAEQLITQLHEED
jgi:hypothetical protein